MKSLLVVSLTALVLGGTLASCGEGEYEVHSIRFVDLSSGSVSLYADETVDTCVVEAYDSWTASSSDTSWLSCSPTSVTVPSGYYSTDWFYVNATPNTTGQHRGGIIYLSSYYDLQLPVQQSANLNIGRPTGTSDGSSDLQTYTLSLAALGSTDSISFTVYSDDASFVGGGDWITAIDTTFSAGEHTFYVTASANWTGNRRQATYTLTSAGVSSDINVTQNIPTN